MQRVYYVLTTPGGAIAAYYDTDGIAYPVVPDDAKLLWPGDEGYCDPNTLVPCPTEHMG